MKIAVIGGGSTYTPELITGFLACSDSLPLTELWLMDIDPERLAIVGGFAQRMVAAKNGHFKVILTQDRQEAVRGASYVITQLRVGLMAARQQDEMLGQRHGLIGQETTGIGGMAKALRTIPVILDIAADVQALAPEALLVNFTNPSGLVTEALQRYAPDVKAIGLCNSPTNGKMMLLKLLEQKLGQPIDPGRVSLDTLGINHLVWHRGYTLDGQDVWGEVLSGYLEQVKNEAEPQWESRLIENLKMIPSYYLEYFYHTARKLAEQAKWPPSRAEIVMEVEADLLRQYSELSRTEPPSDLMKRGGAYYSLAATQLLNAHFNNLGGIHIVNTRHCGAVPCWTEEWILELPCRIDRAGVHPLPAKPLPPVCFGLLAHVKAYELLTVEAAVHGDREAAYQALLSHPLGPAADQVQIVLDDMLKTNRFYLPQFWNSSQSFLEAGIQE